MVPDMANNIAQSMVSKSKCKCIPSISYYKHDGLNEANKLDYFSYNPT